MTVQGHNYDNLSLSKHYAGRIILGVRYNAFTTCECLLKNLNDSFKLNFLEIFKTIILTPTVISWEEYWHFSNKFV